jgi:hypothetical protein
MWTLACSASVISVFRYPKHLFNVSKRFKTSGKLISFSIYLPQFLLLNWGVVKYSAGGY